MKNKYVFKKLEDESRFHTSGKTFDLDRPMEKVAEVWGSLITLFGRTKYVAEDMEEAFSYFLEAIDNKNYSIYFNIYYGATGLAVGIGKEDHESDRSKEMVHVFMDKLGETVPTDFDYVGYYWDYGCKVELGVVHGKGYARDIELDEEDL